VKNNTFAVLIFIQLRLKFEHLKWEMSIFRWPSGMEHRDVGHNLESGPPKDPLNPTWFHWINGFCEEDVCLLLNKPTKCNQHSLYKSAERKITQKKTHLKNRLNKSIAIELQCK